MSEEEHPQYGSNQDEMKKKFRELFLLRTRDEWTEVFKDLDACFAPILDPDEAANHPHNQVNRSFLRNQNGEYEPGPAPKLSRTPAVNQVLPQPGIGQHSVAVLKEVGYKQTDIEEFITKGVVDDNSKASKL